MTAKKSAHLSHPISKDKWNKSMQSDRITYAQPPRLSWRDAGNYTGTELHHRSMRNQPPSVLMGKRVGG